MTGDTGAGPRLGGPSCSVCQNGLTRAKNLILLRTNLEEETVSLILKGLKQSWDPKARGFVGRE